MPVTTPSGPRGRQPRSLQLARHWTWFRENFGSSLAPTSLATTGSGVDRASLAAAFWQWVGLLDADARFEKIDPVDFTHYAAGQLLRCLLTHRPLRLQHDQRSQEVRAMTQAAMAWLVEWRSAIDGGAALDARLPDEGDALWAGFLEDTAQDAVAAVAYLDRFSGVEPDWQSPQLVISRPAMRAALEALRAGGVRGDAAD